MRKIGTKKTGKSLDPRRLIARDLPGEPYVGGFFSLLFWAYLVAIYGSYLLGEGRYPVATVTVAFLALIAAWISLPWSTNAARWRLVAAPAAFVLVSFLIVHLTGFGLSAGLYTIAVANGVFVFGLRWGVAYAAALVPLILVNHLWSSPEAGVVRALELTAYSIPTFVFVVGMCAMTARATQRQERAQELLGELREVNAELRRYADRVKELAISEERTRMAREMHDSLGHHLMVVDLQIKAAVKLLEHDPERAGEAVVRAGGAASDAISEVRRAIRALKPLGIEERRGSGALAALARGFDGTGTTVSFEVLGEERSLSSEADLILYRTLQEGLTNALKHSGAGHIEARLDFQPSSVRLVVADDGCGAGRSMGETRDGGFGLAGLRQRVTGFGGTFHGGNTGEGGFILEVELPLERT